MLQSIAYAFHLIRARFSPPNSSPASAQAALDEILADYRLSNETYEKIRDILDQEMTNGLSRQGNPNAVVKMFVTYVQSLPDGSESGNYLALDLGGTNFRVLLISLEGETVHMQNKIYPISEELMKGAGTKLFDYIADCIANFVSDHQLQDQSLPLGFTFSFPCRQEGLAVGRLVHWTKGFCCEGVEGEDVVKLLHEAILRQGNLQVNCVAILNDTVGCLMSCAFHDHDTRVGVIFGTGSNASYVETLDRVELWDGEMSEPKQVIINTEWGAFGDNGSLDFIRTKADYNIDRESINPNRQIFEKMISGMYMGELVRLILLDCISKGIVFNGTPSEELIADDHRFFTKYVSEIEKDEDHGEFTRTHQILDELGINHPSIEECRFVRQICQAVSERAAFLASAGIATLVNRINRPNVTVAVDGSLYRFHPHFPKLVLQKTHLLARPGTQIKMMLSEDGSGKGAALVAAVAYRLQQSRQSVSN